MRQVPKFVGKKDNAFASRRVAGPKQAQILWRATFRGACLSIRPRLELDH